MKTFWKKYLRKNVYYIFTNEDVFGWILAANLFQKYSCGYTHTDQYTVYIINRIIFHLFHLSYRSVQFIILCKALDHTRPKTKFESLVCESPHHHADDTSLSPRLGGKTHKECLYTHNGIFSLCWQLYCAIWQEAMRSAIIRLWYILFSCHSRCGAECWFCSDTQRSGWQLSAPIPSTALSVPSRSGRNS